ncbi:hypothetical protein ASF06_03325 [Agreia sp. Leaf244]|nr:hypothetical protein ASF06_03325 [Agreia sp. Leaf244]
MPERPPAVSPSGSVSVVPPGAPVGGMEAVATPMRCRSASSRAEVKVVRDAMSVSARQMTVAVSAPI